MTESDDWTTIRELVAMVRQKIQAVRADTKPAAGLETRLELHDQVTGLQRALDAALSLHEVPIELCHALRAPADTSHLVHLDIEGHPVEVVVQPLGRVDPEREIAVWRQVIDAVGQCAGPGQQLRRMEPEILAVQASAVSLVVNTEHSRASVRAAIRLLQDGAFLPTPLAWAWHRARRYPGRAATIAVIAAVAVGLAFTTATQPTTPVEALDAPTASVSPSDLVQASPFPATSAAPSASTPVPLQTEMKGTPRPSSSASTPATDSRGGKRPAVDGQDNDDTGERPGPSPTARPSRSSSPPGWTPPPKQTTSPRPAPTTRPPAAPTTRPPAAPSPAPPVAKTGAPSTSTPKPNAPAPQPTRSCPLIDVNADLPILDLDVCL